MRAIVHDGSFDTWREQARSLLTQRVPPSDVQWSDPRDKQDTLDIAPDVVASSGASRTLAVPRAFVERARLAACHRDPERWPLLYRLLWRMAHGERGILADPLDDDVRRLETIVREVGRDEHKMHAFVRFRKVTDDDGDYFVAFHRPDHYIVRLAAPFFVDRFRAMRWSILTPDECAHWDGASVRFTAGVDVSAAPQDDELEDVWRAYYTATFNPARVNPRAMLRELPARHWATLPEARVIPQLIADASTRVQHMLHEPATATSARPFVPSSGSLDVLRAAASSCTGCPLHATATHVVFGEGPESATLMLVGEQPGDEEDQTGRPFVGPAGRVLDEAITAAGLIRSDLYVTNAVKHFTFRREGKRRIHERPRAHDVRACRPWIGAEIERVQPHVIVCLGATAAQALIGANVRIQRDRGRVMSSPWARHILPTFHPSAVLRADDVRHSDELFAWLVEDLRHAGNLAAGSSETRRISANATTRSIESR